MEIQATDPGQRNIDHYAEAFAHRLKDLADVQELINVRHLQADFAEHLDPYVREKFLELYEANKQRPPDESDGS